MSPFLGFSPGTNLFSIACIAFECLGARSFLDFFFGFFLGGSGFRFVGALDLDLGKDRVCAFTRTIYLEHRKEHDYFLFRLLRRNCGG